MKLDRVIQKLCAIFSNYREKIDSHFLNPFQKNLFDKLHSTDKDQIPNKITKLFLRASIYYVVSICVINFDPFGIPSKSDQAVRDVIYNLFSPLYPETAKENIIIVLLTEEDTEKLHNSFYTQPNGTKKRILDANEWPITYRDHGEILSSIMNYEPRSLFVDIFFRKERSTDTTADMSLNYLSEFSEVMRVKTYFAGGYATDDSSVSIERSDFQKKINSKFEMPINGWIGAKNNYPLSVGSEVTAAYRLYEDACLSDAPMLGCHNPSNIDYKTKRPISVFWGRENITPAMSTIKQDCNSSYFGDVIDGLTNSVTSIKCPFHKVVFASDIKLKHLNGEQEELEQLFKDKIVLYSADFLGMGDYVNSPVHGQLPGVHFHAMALDNLMTMGDGYIKASLDSSEQYVEWITLPVISLIMAYFAIFTKLGKYSRLVITLSLTIFYALFSTAIARVEPLYAMSIFQGLAMTIISIDAYLVHKQQNTLGEKE